MWQRHLAAERPKARQTPRISTNTNTAPKNFQSSSFITGTDRSARCRTKPFDPGHRSSCGPEGLTLNVLYALHGESPVPRHSRKCTFLALQQSKFVRNIPENTCELLMKLELPETWLPHPRRRGAPAPRFLPLTPPGFPISPSRKCTYRRPQQSELTTKCSESNPNVAAASCR